MIKIERNQNNFEDDIVEYVAATNTILEVSELQGSDYVEWQTDRDEKFWGTLTLRDKIALSSGQRIYLRIDNGIAYLAEMKGLL